MGSVIGDAEIGVGALPALAAGGSAGSEVGGHLGRVAVEVVPDRALDVGKVSSITTQPDGNPLR